MAYSFETDILKEMSFSDLAKLSGDDQGLTINEERIDRALEIAKNLIDATLDNIVEIDQEDVPELIKDISVSLSIANLYRFQYAKSLIPNVVYKREATALDTLIKIAEGEYSLIALGSRKRASNIIIKRFPPSKSRQK